MSVLIWFNSLLVLENDTCKDGSECVIVIIVFRYVIYIVTKFIKIKKNKNIIYYEHKLYSKTTDPQCILCSSSVLYIQAKQRSKCVLQQAH